MRQGSPSSPDHVAAVRSFNRFYTQRLGVLNRHLLKSRFSLTEARLLYELANREGLTASDVGRDLKLDAGYLSRLLKTFTARGLLRRVPSATDARRRTLALTPAGRAAFTPLNQGAAEEIRQMLAGLSPAAVEELLRSMRTVHRLMAEEPGAKVTLRALRPGDIGWITHRQGLLYFHEYGWDETFEALVAEITGAFVKNFNPERERCWVADRDGDVVGSVFLIRETDEVAKLRLLYVEASARGLGLGRRLVDECVRFAREKGYRRLVLWTNDVLGSARRIYESAGFRLVREEPHHSFGKDLVGQYWELDLGRPGVE